LAKWIYTNQNKVEVAPPVASMGLTPQVPLEERTKKVGDTLVSNLLLWEYQNYYRYLWFTQRSFGWCNNFSEQ
jgi:hypothetical protein